MIFFLKTLIISIIIIPQTVFGQSFSGTITYRISYIGNIKAMPRPTEMKLIIKKNKIRKEVNSPTGKHIIITDSKKETACLLLNLGQNKIAVLSSSNETRENIKRQQGGELKIFSKKKKIAGYKCRKALLIHRNDTITVYYTNKLDIPNPNWHTRFGVINYFLMEYSQEVNKIKINYKVHKIEKHKVADSTFTIPKDFQKISMKEFHNLLKN